MDRAPPYKKSCGGLDCAHSCATHPQNAFMSLFGFCMPAVSSGRDGEALVIYDLVDDEELEAVMTPPQRWTDNGEDAVEGEVARSTTPGIPAYRYPEYNEDEEPETQQLQKEHERFIEGFVDLRADAPLPRIALPPAMAASELDKILIVA